MKSCDGFISDALTGGGTGKSNGIKTESIGKGQRVMRSYPPDNVKLAMPIETSMKSGKFGGGTTNLRHSLAGASAVDDGTGAA